MQEVGLHQLWIQLQKIINYKQNLVLYILLYIKWYYEKRGYAYLAVINKCQPVLVSSLINSERGDNKVGIN